MRKKTVLWQLFVLLFITAEIHAQELPSKWYFGKPYHAQLKDAWCENAAVAANEYGSAIFKVEKANGERPDTSFFCNYKPVAGPIVAGDCLVIECPNTQFPAGSYVEFDLTFTAEEGAPANWIFEWYDDGKWHSGRTYTVYALPFARDVHQFTSVLETVKLQAPANGTLKMRMRALEGELTQATSKKVKNFFPQMVVIQTHAYLSAYAQDLGVVAPKDTTQVLCLGNSFTYYCSCPALLKEIAWNEGHYLEMTAAMKGGRNFAQHTSLEISGDAIARGGFDYAILQDQSQAPARLAKNKKEYISSLDNAVALAQKIKASAPTAQIVVEATWSYANKNNDFGGFANFREFDNLSFRGATMMARAIAKATQSKTQVSPIAAAYAKVRKERPDINLYSADDKHQSMLGSYLKSCVNYLILFKEPFGANPANCGIDPAVAAYLRSVAESVVL